MISPDRMRGTITRLIPNNGYGFVRGEDHLEYFMHCKEVTPRIDFDTMREGQGVEFEPHDDGPGGNRLRAKKVTCHIQTLTSPAGDRSSRSPSSAL
jgi:cold shock CspA family protein